MGLMCGWGAEDVPMCCFLLQGIEINTGMKPNSLVQTAAAAGDLWHRCVGLGVLSGAQSCLDFI